MYGSEIIRSWVIFSDTISASEDNITFNCPTSEKNSNSFVVAAEPDILDEFVNLLRRLALVNISKMAASMGKVVKCLVNTKFVKSSRNLTSWACQSYYRRNARPLCTDERGKLCHGSVGFVLFWHV